MAKCPSCGANAPYGAKVCEYCGTVLRDLREEAPRTERVIERVVEKRIYVEQPERTVYVQQPARTVYIPQPSPAVSPKNRLVDLLLCFFLGLLGIHKFYEGKIGMCFLYIMTVGGFGFFALIDFFVILLGHPKDKAGLPIVW